MLALPESYAIQARWVLPMDGPPLHGGVVAVDHERIRSVGLAIPDDCEVVDLGNVAVLPGLVNAHAHLDFSALTTPLGQPGITFPEWLELVVRRRRQEPQAEADSLRRAAILAGYRESIAHGTTTLGDIAGDDAIAAQQADPSRTTPTSAVGLDYTSFLELIGFSAARSDAQQQRLAAWIPAAQRLAAQADGHWRPGLSPHAPYTVRTSLIEAACRLGAVEGIPLAIHLAESREELDLLARQEGPLVDALRRLDAWDPTAIRRGTRPHDYLELLAAAPRTLIVHGNYLDAGERAMLAARASRMAVVYCPRTHSYFGHEPYPLAELLSAGATVALGTDGRGSNPDLSLLAEMRHVARHHPAVSPAAILQLGTLSGAKALGCADRVGSLTVGRDANLAIVPLPDRDEADPHRLVIDSNFDVRTTVYRGRVVYDARTKSEVGGRRSEVEN